MTKKWLIEILFLLMTVVIAALIMLPICNAEIDFPFFSYNVIFILLGITLIRYLLLWHWHPWAHYKWLKVVIIFMLPIVIFPLIEGLHSYVEYFDQRGLTDLMIHLPYKKASTLVRYIHNEYLFFAVTTFISIFLLVFKMIRELWLQLNRNKYESG